MSSSVSPIRPLWLSVPPNRKAAACSNIATAGAFCSRRVALARALAHEPAVLLADEPTGSLDRTTGEQIMELLAEIHGEGLTIVMVTHEPAYAKLARRIIEIEDGRIIH